MPFLRAALRKKQEAVQEELLRPPVVVPVEDEEPETEPELPEPTTIAELHGIIDRRTEESEIEPEIVHNEPEITADTESEILTDEPANVEGESPETLTGESDISTGESVEAVSVEGEESEALTAESETASGEGEAPEALTAENEIASSEGEESETLTAENETASGEGETPETLTAESEPANGENETPSSDGGGKFDGSELQYDFTSGERYVDKVSTKTEFDRMLDELAAISKDLLSWEAEKFAKEYTGRFTEGSDTSQSDARKYEAFLGGYITNAAMLLYDKGYREAAIKQLEQAKSILEARKKLEDETSAIKSRVEEQNDTVDLSDILGLFGDG